MKRVSNLATLKERRVEGDQVYHRIEFVPGLPYAPGTKGMPFKRAYFTVIDVQGATTHKWRRRGVLCRDLGSGGPDLAGVHAERDGVETPDVMCEALGYKFVDAIENKKRALVESAKAKLNPEERKALGLK